VPLPAPSPDALNFVARVAHAYEKLIVSPHADPESGLGGSLFYAGEMDEEGRALVVAANIAGAATLVASADPATQKQAIRDQLRKRETVSVCVAMAPAAMEREMNERGVRPDLLRHGVPIAPLHEALTHQEGGRDETDPTSVPALVIWRVDSANRKDLAVLDATALECLDANDWPGRRWLRLAPRYLGRMAKGLRLLSTHLEFAARFSMRLRERVDRDEIKFPYEIRSYVRGLEEKHLVPASAPVP
jgi:urocanate hydratase